MKKTDVTYQDKFNELRLDISHPNSRGINFVLVEGESDIKLFRKLFDSTRCKVETIPGGKEKVEQCVENLSEKYKLVIGIRDADFINLSATEYTKTNMFLTDCHDIEMTMLAQDTVLQALICEFTDYSQKECAPFLNNIMKSIEMVSYLKWLNNIEDLKLKFSGSGFLDLIDFSAFKVNFSTYLPRILAKSADAKIQDEAIINNKINDLGNKKPDLMQLTNGHDLLSTLAKFFKEVAKRKGHSDENIATALRMTFTVAHFQQTQLYGELTQWEVQNKTALFTKDVLHS